MQSPTPREYQPGADKTGKAGQAAPAGGGLEVGPAQVSYAKQAAHAEPVNRAAVGEARRLIQEGLLDTPAAAVRAARAILDLGP